MNNANLQILVYLIILFELMIYVFIVYE